jgi:rhodanese-related sulfurtransferase
MSMQTISPQDLHHLLQQHRPVDLIDVRTPSEYAQVHIDGARLVPLSSLRVQAVRSDRQAGESEPIYVVCHSGGRSQSACAKLESAGLNAVNVAGGTRAWIKAGLPVVRQSAGASQFGECKG